MEMTEREIYNEWKNAKNPKKQVGILADQNGCKNHEILAIIDKFQKKMINKLTEQPADKPVEKPADKPVEKPADKPVEKPAEPATAKNKHGKGYRLTGEEKNNISKLYSEGMTVDEVAAAMGLSVSSVQRTLKANGLTRPRTGQAASEADGNTYVADAIAVAGQVYEFLCGLTAEIDVRVVYCKSDGKASYIIDVVSNNGAMVKLCFDKKKS